MFKANICKPWVLVAALLMPWTFSGCGGAPNLHVPENMPEICRGLDFAREVGMREICGVRTMRYKAYRNVPEHRALFKPKGAMIVRKGETLELRLEKTLPMELPKSYANRIDFGEEYRRELLQTIFEYHEFFPKDSDQRMRIMKLTIPMKDGATEGVCYVVHAQTADHPVQDGYASELEHLPCTDFLKLQALATSRL